MSPAQLRVPLRLQGKWLPALQEIVSKITSSFSRSFCHIGCAGEVKLGEHEDYDKFSIQIL